MTDSDVIERALRLKKSSDNGSERSTHLLNDLLYAMRPQDRKSYFEIVESDTEFSDSDEMDQEDCTNRDSQPKPSSGERVKMIDNHDVRERLKTITDALESLRIYHMWTPRELRSVMAQLIDKVVSKGEVSFTISAEGIPLFVNDDFTTEGR